MENSRLEQQQQECLPSESDPVCDFVKSFSKKELAVLAMILCRIYKTDQYIKLFSVFEKEFSLFLGLFNQAVIKVPSIRSLTYYKTYVKIYIFLNKRDFSDDAYNEAARLFGRRVTHLRSIVTKVKNSLEVTSRLIKDIDQGIDGIDQIAEVLHGFNTTDTETRRSDRAETEN